MRRRRCSTALPAFVWYGCKAGGQILVTFLHRAHLCELVVRLHSNDLCSTQGGSCADTPLFLLVHTPMGHYHTPGGMRRQADRQERTIRGGHERAACRARARVVP